MTARPGTLVSTHSLVVVLVTGLVSLSAGLVGVLSPVWVVRRAGEVTVSEGLWYAQACPHFSLCVLSSRDHIISKYLNSNHTVSFHWTEYQIQSSVSLALSMVASVCFTVALVRRSTCTKSVTRYLTIGCLLKIPAGILMMYVVVRIGEEDLYVVHPTERWSLNTAAVGAVIGFITAMFALNAAYKSRQRKRATNIRHTDRMCNRQRSRPLELPSSSRSGTFTVAKPSEYYSACSRNYIDFSSNTDGIVFPPRYEEIYEQSRLGQQTEVEVVL